MKKRLVLLMLIAVLVASVSADVLFEHDFTAAEGFTATPLRWQNGWSGQDLYICDPSGTGIVSVSHTGWVRICQQDAGARGGTGGEPAEGAFNGDVLRVTFDYKFTLLQDTSINWFSRVGFRENGNSQSGWSPLPQRGFGVSYISGTGLKFYPNMNDASSDTKALIVSSANAGISGGDLTTDWLRITWTVKHVSGDDWEVVSLNVENLDTGKSWDYAGEAISFIYTGTNDAFFAMQICGGPVPAAPNTPTVYTDKVKWEINPPMATGPVAHTPNPENGDDEVDSTTLTQVTWEGPLPYSATDPNTEPNLVSVDQYDISYYILNNDDVDPGVDPNWPDTTKVIFDDDVISPYAISIDYAQTMFWRIDTHVTWDSNDVTGAGLTTIETGSNWWFSTKPAYIAPVVTADDVITTVALTTSPNVAALSATVENNSDPITSVTFTLSTDDIEFPAGSDAAVTNTTTGVPGLTPTIAAELTTTVAGMYKVIMVVDDGTTTIEEIIGVNVYADACQAKKDSPGGWTANYYDRDDDCDVDLVDFGVFADEWLTDTTMSAQEDDDFGFVYVPQSIIDARIEAESVDPNAVSDAPVTDTTGIRVLTQAGPIQSSAFLGWSGTDAYAEYEVTVNAAVYDIWISYATPNNGCSLDFGDGTTVDAYGSVDLSNTGNWNDFIAPEYAGALDFTGVGAGTHTLRITWTNGSNLDWFTLVE